MSVTVNTPRTEFIQQTIVKQGIDFSIEDELKEVSQVVGSVLSNNRIARNNDKWLILMCWMQQLKASKTTMNGKQGFFIPLEDFAELLSAESITRFRRLFNSEGKYLADDPVVINRRKKEVKMKEAFR